MSPDLENQATNETISLRETSQAGEATSPSDEEAEQNTQPTASGGQTTGLSAEGKSPSSPFTKTRFGLKKPETGSTNVYDPMAATHDYTLKYKPDSMFHELDEDARVWFVYNDEANAFDMDMIEEASDSLDILLVFAGLFSAVLTTFVVQTSQSLTPDNAAISASLLQELVQLQRANGNQTLINSVPAAEVASGPSGIDRWVNGLWFTGLTLSLSSALLAVLAKQWLRQYRSLSTGTARQRALIRQFRFDGFDRWNVRSIIGFLPTMLHMSLVLFLIGLVLFLIPLDKVTASIIGTITFALLSTYIVTNLLPIKLSQCPYRTPLTDLMYRLVRLCFKNSFGYTKDLKEAQRKAALQEDVHDHQEAQFVADFRALKWLLETTASPSARKIVYKCSGALEISDARLARFSKGGCSIGQVGPETPLRKETAQLESSPLRQVLSASTNALRPPIPIDGDTGSLTQVQKDDLQNGIMATVHLQLLWKTTSLARWHVPNYPSRNKTMTFSLSDLGLALSIMVCPRDFVLVAFIENPEPGGTPVELRSNTAFSWIVDNYASLERLDMPPLVWMHLQEKASWSLKDILDSKSVSEGLKYIIKAKYPSRLSIIGMQPEGWPERGPISLELFILQQVYLLGFYDMDALLDGVYGNANSRSENLDMIDSCTHDL